MLNRRNRIFNEYFGLSISGIGSSEVAGSGCSTSSFSTELTMDMGSYHSQQQQQQQQHSTDTTQTPTQDTPILQTHGIVHHAGSYHPVAKHAIDVPSTATLHQFVDNGELWREDGVQVESQVMPGVDDQYIGAGSAPSEMLTSVQCGGRKFHFPYDENVVESGCQLYTGGGGELRGDLQESAGDIAEGRLA
jgi:hypothetical protein